MIESPVMYDCLWVALVYHHADVLKTLLDALKQKLTHMLSRWQNWHYQWYLPACRLVASPRSLRRMVVDVLDEALLERSRHLVIIVTERFSCQDLDLDGYRIADAVQFSPGFVQHTNSAPLYPVGSWPHPQTSH